MGLRTILKIGDETLTKPSREAKIDSKLFELLDDLRETLAKADGLGLAAPQVGVLRRAAIIIDENNEVIELINPVLVKQGGHIIDAEGCL
ncbi:MAG: peptide deformylase, partial [Oscillospiraceae bacterium]|nr:peptide deformylase [Oscillospiraceae bacterium]